MALKDVLQPFKKEEYILKPLDLYLLSLNREDTDRAINVNAPSQIGACPRANFYVRLGYPKDPNAINPRSRRILDNGHHFHQRIQNYLLEAGILLMDEIPVLNEEYQIQGHTDGLAQTESEKVVIELKSINEKGFSSLKMAKSEHIEQASIYVFCIETHRKELRRKYKSKFTFNLSEKYRRQYYAKFYQHLKSGRKFTREQKIEYQVDLHIKMDKILFNEPDPITKAVLLYENKNTQEIKEFIVDIKERGTKSILEGALQYCSEMNGYVEREEIPLRGGNSKSDQYCRFCDYKTECWN